MGALDALSVWRDADFCGSLGWYRAVAANRLPAKFRILASFPASVPLDAAEPELWRALDAVSGDFLALRERIRSGEVRLPAAAQPPSALDLVAELGRRMLAHCNFCRWDCRVDRTRGSKLGVCKLGAETRVSAWFRHHGEELVYRGSEGSGTIFFTSCNMRCAFCQNGDISADRWNGEPASARALAAMAWLLRAEGCHNINWVGGDPTVHLHTILEAIAWLARADPRPEDLRAALVTKADGFSRLALDPEAARYDRAFNAPMLWNSNFYMSAEAMKLLRLTMDVWLPDFKFGPGRCALELARTGAYWETVTQNLLHLRDWGEDFTIRHLVMPGHVECCTVPVLDWIAEEMPAAPVNIMDQYHPDHACDPGNPQFRERYRPLARRPSRAELLAAFGHARRRGIRFEALSWERRHRWIFLAGG